MKKLKKFSLVLLCFCVILSGVYVSVEAENSGSEESAPSGPRLDCRSALLMEAETGKVLYESNADESLPPASVTKVMTLLLVMEAIDEGRLSLTDTVTASANACSMGGTQIYLEEGEEMTVEDLLKSVIIASANDAAVALAERVAGSEESFVELMNKKAASLGMTGTNFENTNGLDDTAVNHVTTARDIAIMSRELIKHKKITEYSSIWMDTIRNGEFGLTNTNRLIRFYKGATGLKTGSTAKAKFCITATATREGMTLICVIMAAPTRDIRNASATALLDFGFANYTIYKSDGGDIEPIRVLRGEKRDCGASYSSFSAVLSKSDAAKVSQSVEKTESISAPIKRGEILGRVVYKVGDREIGECPVTSTESIAQISFFGILRRMIAKFSLSS